MIAIIHQQNQRTQLRSTQLPFKCHRWKQMLSAISTDPVNLDVESYWGNHFLFYWCSH